jgi:hypothetical protein
MAGSFSTVFAEWLTRMPSDIEGTPVIYNLGAHLLNLNERPPWITWVLSDDTYGAPVKQDSNVPKIGPASAQGTGSPRSIWTVDAGVELHIWGRSIDEVEELRRASIAALHQIAVGSYRVVRGAWDKEGATAETGIAYVLLIELRIPVTMSPDTFVTVTAFPIASKVVLP